MPRKKELETGRNWGQIPFFYNLSTNFFFVLPATKKNSRPQTTCVVFTPFFLKQNSEFFFQDRSGLLSFSERGGWNARRWSFFFLYLPPLNYFQTRENAREQKQKKQNKNLDSKFFFPRHQLATTTTKKDDGNLLQPSFSFFLERERERERDKNLK